MFYSQCGEDKFVYERYFKNKREGIFLELGALDGIQYSNTKFFEDELNWSGILIEPLPHLYESLKRNHISAKCYNCAVTETVGNVDLLVSGRDDPAVSSVVGNSIKVLVDMFHDETSRKITVPSTTLANILQEAAISEIDFSHWM
jgi:FkbM family methyltransferase